MTKFFSNGGAAFAALLGAAMSLQAHAAGQMPPERQAGAASFVSGGVGEGEAQRFESAAAHYPLTVQLYERAGGPRAEYTSDAQVKIIDAKGQVVVDEMADGPFMLVRLPAGDYRVAATLNGRSLPEHAVHVTHSGHAKTTFVFPSHTG